MNNVALGRYLVQGLKDVAIYMVVSLKLKIVRRPKLDIIADEATVDLIKNEGFSLSRYGDGEFFWMQNIESKCEFQENSDDLSTALLRALNSPKNKLLIGMPKPLVCDRGCTFYPKLHWRKCALRHYRWLEQNLDLTKKYANASITRPYMDYQDRCRAEKAFDLMKSIWAGRDVVVFEGANTKFGVHNDLLSGANSVRRVICPAENAFSRYQDIKQTIIKLIDSSSLILLCLGPTATILASDIELSGYQLVDIGHLDIEYEWFLRDAKTKIPIPGKYVNEVHDKGDESLNYDESYIESVIANIS